MDEYSDSRITERIDASFEACRSLLEHAQSNDLYGKEEQQAIMQFYHHVSGGINGMNHLTLGEGDVEHGVKAIRDSLKNLSPKHLGRYHFSENTHTVLIDIVDAIDDTVAALYRRGEIGEHEYNELKVQYNDSRQFLMTPIGEQGREL